MEPRIQYAKTSDGVNIAFASMGEGPPVVRLGVPGITHVQREVEMFPGFVPPLEKDFRVIWYDSRGTGLSDRDAIDFSMEAMIRDLEAVIERTDLQSFAVLAFLGAVPIAVTFATMFPDRVSHLILVDGQTNYADIADSPAIQAHEALIDQDWTLFTETAARVLTGMDDPRLMDKVMSGIDPRDPQASKKVERELSLIAPVCHWTSGKWEDLDGIPWNAVENTPRHLRVLSNYLIRTYVHARNVHT